MCSPEALYAQLLLLSLDTKQKGATEDPTDRPNDDYVPHKRPLWSVTSRLRALSGLLARLGQGRRKYLEGLSSSRL
jgi:hypothetical protein